MRTEKLQTRRTAQGRPTLSACSPSQAGVALLMALVIMLSLSILGLASALLTDSSVRLTDTVENRTQAYYAAVAGLEEARSRLNSSAPDAISSTALPQTISDVLYIINTSPGDTVSPTDPSSPYYDNEYGSEFTAGFAGAHVLASVSSDQPGAGTTWVIPYKWVRITLKTEYSSRQDVNQDGLLNSTTSINWDGLHEDLSTVIPGAYRVYKLTALAVERSGIRKMAQAEVSGNPSSPKTVLAWRELSF